MAFGKDMDAWAGDTGLSLVERNEKKSRFAVSWAEAKLLTIAGVGFLMDAWDLFIINIIYSIILLAYYPKGTKNIDWGLQGGVLKAAANIGNIVGQLFFGFCGDMFGRSAVYGKELVIVIVAVILQISAPDSIGGHGITIWLAVLRFVMGIGIGGDYPMSATIVADRSSLKNRGFLLSWIFSNQGWGNLVGALFAVIVIAGYRHYVDAGQVHKLSGAWRILQGLTLIPAFIVLYFRLTLVESTRFTQARKLQDDPELIAKGHNNLNRSNSDDDDLKEKALGGDATPIENTAVGMSFKSIGKPKNEFIEYFSQWKNAKKLIGCAACWFLVDITFYGINLNQSSILSAIGFTKGSTWGKLMKTATGNLIITAAGFLPGYFFTMFTVDIVGRKPIQLLGFTMNALFLGILAGRFNTLKNQTGPFFVVFVFLQLFFNFGANATTFIVPAEAFPTRVRATAHGFCAACGKCGAILSSLLFSHLASATSLGNQGVFWIFFGVSVLGALVTFFLVPETNGYDADEEDRRELAARAGVQ
ncbi:MFS general substrate transporter [Moesziomyces antarcticus]|uniref:Probable PHO84 - Inorganic phosphate permease n=1 Tax=Pseudozyma antarctica TaxID=84753 RepID=A0A5C3FFP7_PSEA2|nr:MFS general substrate transporter [Moesziomyces antarcticus]GAK62670.1 MFS general substrate transporter [Moesziomyces antarcticus]SPO43232.1 probable PHO84 - Inorganic phosphate permease [Moesziomyces antarcticus]